ncbi:MAG TPA: alkyl hydroperoxide reductase [Chloroflexia bacterium]|nr:alkyl hydroperoxide reductase [Chloroflexia bacterium]
MLPQLRRLEEKYPDDLVVIGVHAGKYTAERTTANVRDAVLRLGIDHPVVNDRFFRIWKGFAVNAWPTVVLVDPRGYYMGTQPGEISFEDFDPIIGDALAKFGAAGLLRPGPLALHAEHLDEPPRPLRYPGKVLAVARDAAHRLFIADSDHHRVIAARVLADGTTAQVEWVAGTGEPGAADGSFAAASFNRPQGMALVDGTLYVADSENHTLRALDVGAQTVRTVAGTGAIGYAQGGGPARDTPLNSPWDLAWVGDTLYIAMAGRHQIWAFDPGTATVRPFAGTGQEVLVDGRLWDPVLLRARTLTDLGGFASLAQPTGLAAVGDTLYVTCSEAQAVRAIDLRAGTVRTLVGTGLFDFGDKDGRGDAVRLQHPFGVAAHAGGLIVADTYNSKIKRLDPRTREMQSWLGGAERGLVDGAAAQARFNEPEGLSVAGDRLYIADTNNHAIRVVRLDDPEAPVATVELRGLS